MGTWLAKSKTFWGGFLVFLAAVYYTFVGEPTRAIELYGIAFALWGLRHKLERIKRDKK